MLLRSSILAAAFSGKLVSQDPDDEPASVLLERIAAETSIIQRSEASTEPANPRAPREGHGMSDSATIVQKLWNYCNVLRDDGLSYQDYIEQLTFLLFLKMADEQTQATVQPACDRPPWPGLGIAGAPRR